MKRNMIVTIGITLAAMLVAANAMAGCTVYRHKNYVGAPKAIAAGQEISSLERKWDNKISAVKVSSGCQLTLWKKADFQGDKREFTSNAKFVGNRWNEVVSSATCSCQEVDQNQSTDRE